MPLYKHLLHKNSEIIIWKYDEGENFDDLVLSDLDLKKIENYHPKKRAEFLMIRRILKKKLPGARIIYNENGQPFLENSDLNISVSHSFPLAGIGFSKEKIGFDIEPVREKISRVKHKFVMEDQQAFIPENEEALYLTIIWSLKESLYKLHHTKHWSLKKHYEVRPFRLEKLSEISCRVHDDTSSDEFTAYAEIFEDFCFTVVV